MNKDITPQNSKLVVGRMTLVHLHKGTYDSIPAKIDTGADTSAIDSCKVNVTSRGHLQYILFNPKSPFYDGQVHTTKNYSVKAIKSSNGHLQIRYVVKIPIYVGSRTITGSFTLANRTKNHFPILLGSKILKNKFIVDVACNYADYRRYLSQFRKTSEEESTGRLSTKLAEDKVAFYNNYYLNQEHVI